MSEEDEEDYLRGHPGHSPMGALALEGQLETASKEIVRVSATHRAMFNPGTVERMDQLVVKSNLARVASATAIPLGRLIIRS